MTTKAYIKRIIECTEQLVKDGVVSSVEELQQEYGLPVLSEDVLSNETDESLDKVVNALSEKGPVYKTYIQTGANSKIVEVDKTNVQIGHGNLYGDNNKTKESAVEEDCCVKLEKSLLEIKYLKESLKEKEKEIEQKDLLISELINKIH